MKPGRKPLPTTMRLVGGNAGHRALPEGEPKPVIQIPDMPDELSEAAEPFWNEYGQKLAGMRVLSEVDVQALALLCECTATYWAMNATVRRQGVIVKIGKTGAVGYNPHYNAMNKSADQMRQLLTEFGLTPSSRTRVRAE